MQLFDLETDPGEQRDVAALHGEVVQRLKHTFDLMTSELDKQPPPPSADPKSKDRDGSANGTSATVSGLTSDS